MTAYAIAHLHDVEMCDDIVEYLERIDGTLAPYDGHFVIHGARPEIREGVWRGDLIAIAFPISPPRVRGTNRLRTGRSSRCAASRERPADPDRRRRRAAPRDRHPALNRDRSDAGGAYDALRSIGSPTTNPPPWNRCAGSS